MRKPPHIIFAVVILMIIIQNASASASTSESQRAPQATAATAQDNASPPQQSSPKDDEDKSRQRGGDNEEKKFGPPNGIEIGEPKLFDDRALSSMLQAIEENLARLSFFDQTTLASALGRFQGASSSQSSVGLNIAGAPLPQVATTIGGTGEESVSAAPTGTTTTSKTTSSESTTTTQEKQSPNIPQAGTQSAVFTFTPPFGIPAQDLLTEQENLTYQINNLRLLLGRALSDRIFSTDLKTTEGTAPFSSVRPQAVIGFQVSIDPHLRFRNSVADVRIRLKTITPATPPAQQGGGDASDSDLPKHLSCLSPEDRIAIFPPATNDPTSKQNSSSTLQAPSLVSLMPQSKTYNVATIRKSTKSLGLGTVSKILNVGIGASQANETLYLVKDIDTVALGGTSKESELSFGWQFRPVFDRRSIDPGVRQVFAVLALPNSALTDFVGKFEIETCWRRFDRAAFNRKAGMVGDPVPYSCNRIEDLEIIIPRASILEENLRPKVTALHWDDAGGGNILVRVDGEGFIPGTGVIIGDTTLQQGAGLTFQGESKLRFISSAARLSSVGTPLLVGRYGDPKALLKPGFINPLAAKDPSYGLDITHINYLIEDASNTRVQIFLTSRSGKTPKLSRPIAVIGSRVFGLSDSPFRTQLAQICKRGKETLVLSIDGRSLEPKGSDECTRSGTILDTRMLDLIAPRQLLSEAKKIVVKDLFLGSCYEDDDFIGLAERFSATKVDILSSDETGTEIAISGRNFLDDLTVRANGRNFSREQGNLTILSTTLAHLKLTAQEFKGLQRIIVNQANGEPFVLEIKTPPAPSPKPVVNQASIPQVLTGDITTIRIKGANFTSIASVRFIGDQKLDFVSDEGGETLDIQLTEAVTRLAGEKELTFVLKDGKTTPFKLNVASRP